MTTHYVKSWPHLFDATISGRKKHELRRATDRDYQEGDLLVLQEFEPASAAYTGRQHTVVITFVTSAAAPCALSESALNEDFCILSIAEVNA